MSNDIAVTPGRREVVARRESRDRFFLAMSATLLLLVLTGFTRTLYLRAYFDVPEMPAYVLVHGAVLTTWFVWGFVQTAVVASVAPMFTAG